MKRKFISLLTLTLLTSGLLVTQSCKKQECPVDEPTQKEILLKAGWKGIKVEEYTNGNLTQTVDFSNYEWFFLSNGSMIMYDGGQPVLEYGYTLNGNVESIDLDDHSGGIYHLVVKELNEGSLKLELASGANTYLYYFRR